MNDLFCSEIEAECRAAAEHATLSIQFDQKAGPASKKVTEKKKPVPLQREPQAEKKIYPYVLLATVFIGAIIAVFFLWPDMISEKISQSLPTSERTANLKDQVKTIPQPNEQQAPSLTEKGEPSEQPDAQQPQAPPKTGTEEQIVKKANPVIVRGNLTINAIPWAEIYINGQHYGATPKTIKALKVGNYSLRLENPNYDEWTTKVTVSGGKTANISHKFEGFGKIIVNAVPWGNVYLDGELKGQTPITIQKVPARMHEITISREGYTEVRRSVEIKTGSSEQISVKLQKKGI
jgi:hypothetical protein